MKGKRIFTAVQRSQIRSEWHKIADAEFDKIRHKIGYPKGWDLAKKKADNALAKKWGVPKKTIYAITCGEKV